MMKNFKQFIEQGMPGGPPMGGGGMGGPPGMDPMGGAGGGMGGPPGMDPMGGGMGGPPMGGGMGGPPGMDPMGGGMGGPPPAQSQPAALTAKPKTVWEAMESILQKMPNAPVPQQQQPQKPKPQLNFLKGVPGA